MALEFGSGTQADPYLLVNLADVTAWLTTKQTQGYWFALVSDLDLSGSPITVPGSDWRWNLDGRGFKIILNLKSYKTFIIDRLYTCALNFVNLALNFDTQYFTPSSPSGYFTFNNSIFEFLRSITGTSSRDLFSGVNGMLIEPSSYGFVRAGSSNIYKHGSSVANTINTNSFADGNKFNPKNYPGLNESDWVFDGLSLPRPRPKATADLTTRFGVKGQTKVGGNNRQRNLAVFTENGLRYKVQDTKADGSFFMNLNDVSTPVIVLAYDDIGAKAAINTAYSLNQIIHPAIPNGFRYRCTLAGNSGATIPSEPWPTSVVLTIGAAKFTPEPVYEPKAHGPLLPVLFNVITEQPV
ncbi:hypothetical protein [Aeromonas veronii]|uniref:hypothetical protein n=1 Tax=Aeromonas veronii TaxID=654 RepID=UPI001D0799B6|nr:hypothetical protein [Aeromonas veronii]